MTTDVTWGYFEHVRRPPEWRTLRGRIAYMMERNHIQSKAKLGELSGLNPRQVANQLRRLENGGDLELETVKALARGLKTNVGWLGNDEGWPNEEVRKLFEEGEVPARARSTPPPPAIEDETADTVHRIGSSVPPDRHAKRRPKSGN